MQFKFWFGIKIFHTFLQTVNDFLTLRSSTNIYKKKNSHRKRSQNSPTTTSMGARVHEAGVKETKVGCLQPQAMALRGEGEKVNEVGKQEATS